MIIREENLNDIALIEAITIEAFLNAPHTDHTEQFIVRELRIAKALSISLVAEENGLIIGHVAVSPVSISDGTTNWFGLGPISVQPQYQSKGVGTKLMCAAIEKLKDISAAGCVLLGDPNYYKRFGFEPESSLVLADVPAEYFQALSFVNLIPSGQVNYHKAFNAKE